MENEITKEDVLIAFNIIERYSIQKKSELLKLEVEIDNRDIRILKLDKRELNSLKAGDVKTVGELLSLDRGSLIRFRNMGKKGVDKINEALLRIDMETIPFDTKY